jgi:hypothetical protein
VMTHPLPTLAPLESTFGASSPSAYCADFNMAANSIATLLLLALPSFPCHPATLAYIALDLALARR